MRVKLISPNLNMLAGCRGNEAGRGNGLVKGFGNGVARSCGMQYMNYAGGQGPRTNLRQYTNETEYKKWPLSS